MPKQYEFLSAQEEWVGYVSGVGGGKTNIGSIKATFLSMHPNNRGLVGRFALPDLEDTAQRDLLDFLTEAQLLKEAPNQKTKRALVYCVDPVTNKNLGYTSEITFQHLDDPDHLRGRHLGWWWIDEASELRSPKAMTTLTGRLRLPAFQGRYKGLITGNPRGRNWVYDFFFNQEVLETIVCGKPGCAFGCRIGGTPQQNAACNRNTRLKRRGIHSRSYDNYFLPNDYIDNMVASYTEEQRRREIEAEFDVFEGQVFKEFQHDTHVIRPPEQWIDGRPPKEWTRLLGCDVGGSSPWAFEIVAVDPWGNLVFYNEVYEVSSNVEKLADIVRPWLVDENREAYHFQAKVIDYENKVAATDLQKRGITFTNARKMNKTGDGGSVQRLSSYLHPNPRHHYPDWHPRAGMPNSPRMFISTNCPALIRELPQQQWDTEASTDRLKDQMDRKIPNHATDVALYISRELPHPAELKVNPYAAKTANLSKASELYWWDRQRIEAEKASASRQPYRMMRSRH